ncbi:uncharacterized protein RHOBADRAFT_66272 [Rhodotorula graminis WP1]|uniref:Cytochrome c oxidase assembly factor 3 n=1 Tax=Rhodotorula graminis (strain WP1) TaxID=578459 RepID=A0A194S4T6_RHOGW|nr:uncharacterized protein RHOBADRAFT_66272 [Rhodotorula graminis WP1]KPV75748.1 hypothetical protein RHOBADRAFT_66272 [Rhodotorula graminis WP1]
MSASGLSSREARQTYHPGGYGVSEGLKRARRPFRTRNFVTGSLIFGFAASVYFYSIRAVAQDDFSDLDQPLSDDKRRSLTSIEEQQRERDELRLAAKGGPLVPAPGSVAAAAGSSPVDGLAAAPASAPSSSSSSGVLSLVSGAFAGKGADSKLVWGAPPVDRVGRIGADGPVAEQYPRRIV